jgi:hypothetical protein
MIVLFFIMSVYYLFIDFIYVIYFLVLVVILFVFRILFQRNVEFVSFATLKGPRGFCLVYFLSPSPKVIGFFGWGVYFFELGYFLREFILGIGD